MKHHSSSEEETFLIGQNLASHLKAGTILAIKGDLGAGKTTLVKGIISKLLGIDPNQINSPTFSYLNIYVGNPSVYHFDLYRIKDEKQFFSMGFDEFFNKGGICCIEWPERISNILPKESLIFDLKHISTKCREIYGTFF